MKNILLISNYKPGTGGISVQVELLHNYLNKEGYRVEIFNTKKSVFRRLFLPFSLLREGKKYEIFHIHGCSYWGFFPIVLGIIVGKLLRKKIIVSYHGGDADTFFAKHPGFVRFFLTKSDMNIVLSGFLGNVFQRHAIPFVVIPNIIDVHEDQFIKRDKIEPHYISVRSLYKLYNVQCIIEAFRLVKDHYPQASLTILGDGPCRLELEQLVAEQEIEQVVFTGRVDNLLIYKFLAEADIFVSSPVIDNQPVSILEAFNAGLLVISSRVGGIPYLVEDTKSGYLFESNQPVELAEKMIVAVENQKQTLLMIHTANKALEAYKWESVKEKLLGLYQ